MRVGAGELGPGVGARGLGPGARKLSEAGARELAPESWNQRVRSIELGPGERWESAGGGATEFGPESWDQRVEARDLGPRGHGSPPEMEPMLGAESWDH